MALRDRIGRWLMRGAMQSGDTTALPEERDAGGMSFAGSYM